MLDSLPINTESFHKFATTLSLISSIYFFSFDELFLAPYNKQVADNNIEKALLAADNGYLTGVSLDLSDTVKSIVVNGNIEYFYYSKKDTSEFIRYYSTVRVGKVGLNLVDSLNTVNRQLAKVKFKIKALDDTSRVLEKNIRAKTNFSIFGAIMSFCLFLFSLKRWYKEENRLKP